MNEVIEAIEAVDAVDAVDAIEAAEVLRPEKLLMGTSKSSRFLN